MVQFEFTDPIQRRNHNNKPIIIDKSKALQLQRQGLGHIINQDKSYETKIVVPEIRSINVKKKNKYDILWIADRLKIGGAELSGDYLIDIGRSFGFTIALVTPETFTEFRNVDCKLIILNNIFYFNTTDFNELLNMLFEKRIPFIKYEHDYRPLSHMNIYRQIFAFSKANVFISPDHRNRFEKITGVCNSFTFPIAIDTNKYICNTKNMNNKLLIPSVRKCVDNIMYDSKEINNTYASVTAIGTPNRNLNLDKVKYIPEVTNDEMVDLYNEHEYVYHKPVSMWAGDRIYFEALLCKCKMITNSNVGHVSWNYENYEPDKLRNTLHNANIDFWRMIDAKIS